MSGQDANFVTHDSFGTEPTAGLLTFEVKWKNSGDFSSRENNKGGPDKLDVSIFYIDPREERDWNSFRYALLARSGNSIDDRVNYIDSDGDEIPIESQCEFDEALRFATIRATKKRTVHLIVLRGLKSVATKQNNEITRKIDFISSKTCDAMPPMKLDDTVHDFRRIPSRSETNYNVKQPLCPNDDSAPKWFTNYMQTMKEDIVTEVSQRVTKTVMEALQKKRDSQYDSATSHPHASDSECLVDSDFDDERSESYSPRPRIEKIILKDVPSEKRNSDASSRSEAHRYENNSRRRYRNAEKQRKKQHNKRNVSQAPNNIETQRYCNSPSLNRRRDEKTVTKTTEYDEMMIAALAAPWSENSGNEEEISGSKTARESENQVEELDTPYRRMIASGITQTSFTPINSTDLLEAPILKLRLATSCSEQTLETKLTDDKLRMGCSVTGDDMLERPNDRVPEYCALSDSDNISIISDVSHNSDMQRISNSFEMILQRSMNFPDDENEHFITTEFEENNGELAIEDLDHTRDSSSFELLSEPPSPPLSIHMDEDHFSPAKNETNNYNINDETILDKRGNQNKIEVCPLAIDAQGKIYQRNIIEADEEFPDVTLEKRTDGAYSFVAENLPGSTRESMIKKAHGDSSNDDETSTVTDGITSEVDHEQTEIPDDAETREGDSDVFHESTQSFHSHTAPQTKNERRDFQGYPSTSGNSENSPRSHVFVDHNASKGLGDTRQSSPKKQSTSNSSSSSSSSNKNHEDYGPERPRTSKKSSHSTSQGSTKRNGNSRQGERAKKFNWSTTRSTRMMDDLVFNAVDPMHILPETLVTGAVHVASSAYTTARRVYDKILTAQTRKTADKSKFGRR